MPSQQAGLESAPQTRELGVLALIAVSTSLTGLTLVALFAPGYLTIQGFPLDDAWIHAVYGRSLATTGTLSYNPGIPSTGATSLLWAVLLALPQLLGDTHNSVVVLTKLLGFSLHVMSAIASAWAVRTGSGRGWPARVSAVIVAGHPALLVGSLSGMETALAGFAAAGLLVALRTQRSRWIAPAAGLAVLARPELGVVCAVLPLLMSPILAGRVSRIGRTALGTLAGLGIGFSHNLFASGRWLPSTFHAKVGGGHGQWLASQKVGFGTLLGDLPLLSAPLLVVFGVMSAVIVARSSGGQGAERPVAAAAAVLAAITYFAVSFALIAPVDPEVFYHQRYVFPAMPLLLAAFPVILRDQSARLRASIQALSLIAAAIIVLITFVVDVPSRFSRLGDDTRNIDDTQVRIGLFLANVSADTVVWAVDAGAIRYFGNAFVVDTLGLNTPEILTGDAVAFLDAHRPTYLEVVGGWSSLSLPSSLGLWSERFSPTTEYTVTSFRGMQDRYLVACMPPGAQGTFSVRGRRFHVKCGSASHYVHGRSVGAPGN